MSGSNSSIFDALSSPGVAALIGAAQGFGQAAMPTRMPTPIGAVLGMGGAGALQGAATGQALQKAGMQNQQTKLLMDAYRQQYGGGTGAPFGAPPANGSVGSGSSDNSGISYLPGTSPRELAQRSMLYAAAGQPNVSTQMLKMLENYGGAPGYVIGSDQRAYRQPGSAVDPSQIQLTEASKARGTKLGEAPFVPPSEFPMPALNSDGTPILDAQGQPTFNKRLMTPPQANAAVSGGSQAAPNADPFPGWSRQIMGGENATGNPAARNASGPGGAPTSTAMGNGQFIDGTWPTVIRAARPDLAAGKTDAQLLPLRANPDLATSATEQYARMNGAALANAGLPVNGGTVALAHFLGPQGAMTVLKAQPNAPLGMLPGMAASVNANPQLRGMTAGGLVQQYQSRMGQTGGQAPGIAGPPVLTPEQEAALKIRTAQQTPYDLRPGGMHVDPAAGTETKNPELKEITNQDGTKSYVHINPASPMAPPGTPGTAAPIAMAGAPGQTVGSAVSPDTQDARNHLVTEFHGKDADSYVAAQNTQGWLNQIDHAADVMNKAGPAYRTGEFAPQRLALMGAINDVGRSIGVGSLFDQNAIAAAEEMRKATTTAGFELSSHYEGHARQAAATIMNATSAVPGMSNSPQGVQLVSAGIHEGAQSAMDAHEYKQQRYNGADPYGINPTANGKTAGAGLETAETDFYKKFPASMYSTRAISTVQPPSMKAASLADAQAQFEKYLPGTQVILNGQPKIVPARPGAPAIPAYIQQRFMAPANGG